jgi:putative nucleotidyltransferase with HDIG domain
MWGRSSVGRWPYVLGATALVTGMPACVVTFLAPSGSALELLGGLLLAVALSIGAAKVGAMLWMRHPLARDVLFADLMVWEWIRRLWVERRIARAQSAAGADHLAPHARAEALRDLARLLEARDAYTHGHSRRVARHALRIAQALHVPAIEAERIWTAATLHDVGKLYTPREILNKPGRLTDDEFDVIKRHPVDGAAMLADVEGDPEIVAIVRSHHERLDGRGYPDGLAGDAIPLGARIIAVADTFDALTSTRSYRPAASHKRALDVLRKEAGAQLDGAAVAAFVRTYSGRRPAALSSLVALGPQRALAWVGHQAGAVAGLAPAAGWIAPVAAAAATAFGAAHGTDHAAGRAAGHATRAAAVRVALPARIVPSGPASDRSARPKAPAAVKAKRPTSHHQDGAPKPPAATPPAQAATKPAAAASTPAPAATSEPSADSPATTAMRQVVATVKAAPALPSTTVSLPVQVPALPLPAVSEVVTSTVTQTTEALPVVSKVLQSP